jgi:hypothetical protein
MFMMQEVICMTEGEIVQKNVEEFSRLQQYMQVAGKDSEVYKLMKMRYLELKVILNSMGVNLTQIDIINE